MRSGDTEVRAASVPAAMGEPITKNSDVDTSPAATTSRRRRVVAIAASMVAVLGWWAWPTISGADTTAPVVVMTTPAFTDGQRMIESALRTRGRSVQVVVAPEGWCQVVSAGRDLEASLRVVVADPEPGCDPWESTGDGGSWWWVAPSGVGADTVVPSHVSVVDLTWTLGDAGTLRRGCEWWDDCEADGQVTLRSEPGVLTAAGLERVARVVAVLR